MLRPYIPYYVVASNERIHEARRSGSYFERDSPEGLQTLVFGTSLGAAAHLAECSLTDTDSDGYSIMQLDMFPYWKKTINAGAKDEMIVQAPIDPKHLFLLERDSDGFILPGAEVYVELLRNLFG